MKKLITAIIALSLMAIVTKVNAQAYDGNRDDKLFAGYRTAGTHSGMELRFDRGLTNYFSSAFMVSYLFRNPAATDEIFMDSKVFSNLDVSVATNFHFIEVLNMGTTFDPYLGMYVGLKATGLQAGARYNFSEKVGAYAQFAYNMLPLLFDQFSKDVDLHPYRNKEHISVGITINF
jgi:hypothetical protein